MEAWGFAWNVVTKKFGSVAIPIAIGAFIALLPFSAIYGGVMVVMQALASEIEPDMVPFVALAGQGFGGLVLLFVVAYLAGGFVTLALKAARGQQTGFGDIFSGGRFFGKYLVAWIVGGIVVGIGFALCVVPGYILQYGLALTPFLIADQGLSGVDGLKRSWEMTKGHKVNIFLFNLIGIAVMIAGELACFIGVFLVSVPMFLIGNAYIYLRIKGENPPAPT